LLWGFVERNKPILVVGAGLAGLTAAIHLAERGLDVVLLESHPDFLGGRTRAREPYRFSWNGVEHVHSFDHGQHCMWAQYWNMRALLARLGLDRNVRSCETTRYLVDDGETVHRLQPFDVDPARPPRTLLHFLAHLAKATRVPGWSAGDSAQLVAALPRLAATWAFDHGAQYDAWDQLSVHEMFSWIGLPPQMEQIFKSMCKAARFTRTPRSAHVGAVDDGDDDDRSRDRSQDVVLSRRPRHAPDRSAGGGAARARRTDPPQREGGRRRARRRAHLRRPGGSDVAARCRARGTRRAGAVVV
jgi:choline dehydrogenase-like flavoprotein